MRAIEIIIIILAVIFVAAVIVTSVLKRRRGGGCGDCGGICEGCPYHKKHRAQNGENDNDFCGLSTEVDTSKRRGSENCGSKCNRRSKS